MNRDRAMKRIAYLTLVLVPGFLCGCPQNTKKTKPRSDIRQSRPKLGAFTRASQEQLQALGKGIGDFSVELYREVAGNNGNFFFSPWSISMALSMAHLGARGKTAAEMEQVLHFPKTALDQSFGTLLERLIRGSTKGQKIAIGNRIFPDKRFSILSRYIQDLKKYYATEVQTLDFRNSDRAAATINAWTKAETRGRIAKLIKRETLDTDTKFVLVNTIFFKGSWKKPFSKKKTRKAAFYTTLSNPIQVDMMSGLVKAGYRSLAGFKVLSLPYAGDRLSMVIVLPDKKDGLEELEKKLDSAMAASAKERLANTEVLVSLPKFHAKQRLLLKSVLEKMGIRQAFSPDADFSGITATKPGVFVSAVIHEANCDVDEEGTVAAAATALVAKGLGARARIAPPTFRADHPFIFFIRDDTSGAILFMGRIVKP